MKKSLGKAFPELSEDWGSLSMYQRFERLIRIALATAIALGVVVALYFLAVQVFEILFLRTRDPFDYRVFQAIFDMVLVVLIAMEFNNSILRSMEGREGFVNVEIVVLIAVMALVRKFMVMDVEAIEPLKVFALAAAILALGVSYWMIRNANRKSDHSG